MLSKRSIRGDYTKQITISFIAILAIFSAILYSYLFFLTFGEIESKLKTQAQQILKSSLHYNKGQKFYIQDDNIVVYFDLYDIAPYAAGIPEFIINVNKIDHILKPEYKEIFK